MVNECGITPVHGIESNNVLVPRPKTLLQKMVYFARHFPNRVNELYSRRNHAETTFSMMEALSGYRLRCRSKAGRKNEVQAKVCLHNIGRLANLDPIYKD